MSNRTVRDGDIWRVGSHIMACGDIERGDALSLAIQYSPSMVLCDPPWGPGPARAYCTKAGISRSVNFGSFVNTLLAAFHSIDGLIAIEMGNAQIKEVADCARRAGFLHIRVMPMFYYRKKPCSCVIMSRKVLPCKIENLPCEDEPVVYRWIIQQFSSRGDRVFDPCVGKGMTAVIAHKMGRPVLGMELNPHRLAFALDSLERAGAGRPEKIGDLHAT